MNSASTRCKLRAEGLPEDWQRTSTRRYPVAPADAFLRARLGPTIALPDGHSAGYTQARAAAAVGIGVHAYAEALHRGTITETAADRWATALGLHPADLWPEWWDVAS